MAMTSLCNRHAGGDGGQERLHVVEQSMNASQTHMYTLEIYEDRLTSSRQRCKMGPTKAN
jgi:hypothetical protein